MLAKKRDYKVRAIEKIKKFLSEMQDNRELYVQNPNKDFIRNRKVTFYDIMWFLIFIGANSMAEEIRRAFNYKNFSFISEAAIFKSRSKIKLYAFQHLLKKFNDSIENLKIYKGYRIVAVDGSDFSSPYDAKSEFATVTNQYGGANRMHVSFVYDILNKIYLDCTVEPKNKADERKSAMKMLSTFTEKILAIMDRGYDGLKMIEHCNRIPNLSYLIRLRRGMNIEIGNLPDKTLDIDMEFEVRENYKRQPHKMKISAWDMEKPCFVRFRLVKLQKDGNWIVFATNLSRNDFSADDLKKLYEKRWQIENSFREIKHSLGALHFHSKKDLFNLQEIFAHIIRFNLTSLIIQEISTHKKENCRYEYEINFKNACHIVQDFCRRYFFDFRNLIKQISFYRHPIRADRRFLRKLRYSYPVSFNYRVT